MESRSTGQVSAMFNQRCSGGEGPLTLRGCAILAGTLLRGNVLLHDLENSSALLLAWPDPQVVHACREFLGSLRMGSGLS